MIGKYNTEALSNNLALATVREIFSATPAAKNNSPTTVTPTR